jgi:hypothetical protein
MYTYAFSGASKDKGLPRCQLTIPTNLHGSWENDGDRFKFKGGTKKYANVVLTVQHAHVRTYWAMLPSRVIG